MGCRKYIFTPEMDAEIREVYQKAVYMPGFHQTGPVKKLAKKFGMPRHKITRQAGLLGVRKITKKEPNWSEEELKILERQAYKHPEVIYRHLKKAGFRRSIQGIVLKRKRMNLLQSLNFETSRSLASCLGIDDHAVTMYIQKGWLKARKRGTKRTSRQGGDHWLIKNKHIRAFIIENVSIMDFRKIDKFWLVDLLAGGSNGLGPLKEKQDKTKDIKDTGIPNSVKVRTIRYYDRDGSQINPEILETFEEAQALSAGPTAVSSGPNGSRSDEMI